MFCYLILLSFRFFYKLTRIFNVISLNESFFFSFSFFWEIGLWFLLSWRQICLIHSKTKGWNILHPNKKTCDMSCMPNKVMSYTISFSTNMLKFYMIKPISQVICLFYEKAEWCKVWHLMTRLESPSKYNPIKTNFCSKFYCPCGCQCFHLHHWAGQLNILS